ncbi:hypothetical protein FOZ60_000772 [Perkinsus olseni]|uniref:Uncharacterized protein n=1 Tax=Perkinsus olseni TaxID=32597 RepID=A0A7J6P1M6_PEROL|nr:hypothetical protein FOZ60_000772 [Perkinsus olseni]
MTALRLIISVSFVAILAYGCGKGGTTKPTPCPTTMKPTPCPTTIKPTSRRSPRDVKKHSGEFVYERSDPRVRVALLAPHDSSSGMFSVEYADGTSYQTGWFDLHPNKEDPASIHVVPESGPGRDAHNAWLAGIRTACPDAHITERDFESFVVDGDGNAQAVFEGVRILLDQIKSDGTYTLQLACKYSETFPFTFKVVGMGLGKAYKVTAIKGSISTLDELVSDLKEVCFSLPDEYYSISKWDTVRFASPDAMFITGNYISDRVYRISDD